MFSSDIAHYTDDEKAMHELRKKTPRWHSIATMLMVRKSRILINNFCFSFYWFSWFFSSFLKFTKKEIRPTDTHDCDSREDCKYQ